jgi:hypothetical protein
MHAAPAAPHGTPLEIIRMPNREVANRMEDDQPTAGGNAGGNARGNARGNAGGNAGGNASLLDIH